MTSTALANGSTLSPDGALTVAQPSLAASAPQQSLLALLDDRLRGRWRLALTIGTVLGLAFGAAAYRLAPVRFASTGSVHVAPRGLVILHETSDTRNLPKSEYEAFLSTQALLLQSERVAARALESPALASLPDDERPRTTDDILHGLNAEAERGTELIMTSFESTSPKAAATVLNAVLDSYSDVHGDGPKALRQQRLSALQRMRSDLRAERNLKLQALQGFVADSQHGAANLGRLLDAKVFRIEELRHELEQAALDAPPGSAAVSQTDQPTPEPTARELDMIDPTLADTRWRYDMQRLRLEHLETELNPEHPICHQARRELEIISAMLQEREGTARAAWHASGGRQTAAAGAASLAQRHLSRERTETLLRRYEDEVRTLNQDLTRLNELRRNLSEADARLAEVEESIRIHQTEGGDEALFSGRIKVTRGVERAAPSKDRRRSLTAVSFAAGFGGSIACFFLLGTVDRRTFSTRQLQNGHASVQCLGVLPRLRTKATNPDDFSRAAHCVHQIRNRIESLRNFDQGLTLAVSSAHPGDGKTTLSMALASSYATAQHRTLIVDADLVGRSITRQIGAQDAPGLREILQSRRLDGGKSINLRPNLSVLPCGADVNFGPESIRHDDFSCLCADLRREYDVIIIDTGPLLGSVELLPVLTSVMGVVLVTRRGRQRAFVDESVNSLDQIGVPIHGVVLNGADEGDCNRYASRSAASRGPRSGSPHSSNGESVLKQTVTFASMGDTEK